MWLVSCRSLSSGSNSSVKMSERTSSSRDKERERDKEKGGSEGGAAAGGGGGGGKEAEKRKRSRTADKLLSSSNPASPGGAKRRRTWETDRQSERARERERERHGVCGGGGGGGGGEAAVTGIQPVSFIWWGGGGASCWLVCAASSQRCRHHLIPAGGSDITAAAAGGHDTKPSVTWRPSLFVFSLLCCISRLVCPSQRFKTILCFIWSVINHLIARRQTRDGKRRTIDAAEPVLAIFIPFSCQNLGPTLPTVQLNHGQFSLTFVCYACSSCRRLLSWLLRLQPTPTRVTSLEAGWQTAGSLWRIHTAVRMYICSWTLRCGIRGGPIADGLIRCN